jgi:UDP-glucose 4-epimerase
MREKIMVVGGAGFIGSHLVDRLLVEGHSVAVLDDLSTGLRENVPEAARFYHLKAESKELWDVLAREKPEALFFLAANSNVPLSVRDPLFDFNSLACALNVMEGCRRSQVKRFIFTSSGFIYGNTVKRPISEDVPFQPISPYAISKQAIEHYLAFYRNVYGLSHVVLRLATVYGPRQVTGALSDYIAKLVRGEQAEFFGDGSKTRDYVYVDDVVKALIKGMSLPVMEETVFNIGSGLEITLKEVYHRVAALLDKKPEPVIRPDRPGELYGYSLSSTRARDVLGWEPCVSFDEGLKKILVYRGLIPGGERR